MRIPNRVAQRAALAAATTVAIAATATGALAACGSGGSSSEAKPAWRVAFFLPHAGADRYEAMDQPYFELRIKQLCPGCVVDYRNAGNKQDVQNQQVKEALDAGARVLVVDVVDSKNATGIVELAKQRNVPVISYDRLILGAPLDYYVSFDNLKIGQISGQALLDAMGAKAATGEILWVNGPSSDNNAVLYRQGAHSVLDGKVKIASEFTMPGPGYDSKTVDAWIKQILPTLDLSKLAGVYCVDDASAGVVAAALTAAGVTSLPPITGHNADIPGLQRMLVGNQYMTAYKPVPKEAEKAAELAYDLLRGKRQQTATTIDNKAGAQPAVLLEPHAVTKGNLKETVIKDGFVTVGALCAAAYTEACQQAGIS